MRMKLFFIALWSIPFVFLFQNCGGDPKLVQNTVVLNSSLAQKPVFDITNEGVILDDELPDDLALSQCLDKAISASGICSIPKGKLVLTNYPQSIRRPTTADGIKDLNGAVLKGSGSDTLIYGISDDGFDVLNLNSVKNFTIQDLSITAVKRTNSNVNGVNGISITNGSSNITVQNVFVFNLPYLVKSDYIDGGKAFTVQSGSTEKTNLKNIIFKNCHSKQVAFGFELSADTNVGFEPMNIQLLDSELEAEVYGIIFSFAKPNQPMKVFDALVQGNKISAGHYPIALSRGRGFYIKENIFEVKRSLDTILTPLYSEFYSVGLFETESATFESNIFNGAEAQYHLVGRDFDTQKVAFRQNSFKNAPQVSTFKVPELDSGFIIYFYNNNIVDQ